MSDIITIDNQILNSKHNEKKIVWDATYLDERGKKPLLVFIHGFKGFKDWGSFGQMAEYLARQKFMVVKVNLSHNGTTPEKPTEFADLESFGHNNLSIELDDLEVLINHLTEEKNAIPAEMVETSKLLLMGHSRGGSLAILKAREDRRVKSLVTLSAVANLEGRYTPDQVAEWRDKGVIYIDNTRTNQKMPLYYQLYEDMLINRTRVSVPVAAKFVNIPWLIIHGSEDKSVPVSNADQLKAWNKHAFYEVIEGADHTYGGYHPYDKEDLPKETQTALDKAAEFFKERILTL